MGRFGAVLVLLLVFAPVPLHAQDNSCGATAYDCGVFYVQRQEFHAAIRSVERALRQSPRDLKMLNLLGIALAGAGRPDDANARFREALRIDPSFYAARKNLAVNEFNRGRLTEAQRELEEVLKHAPEDEITHAHLAEIHFQRNELRMALSHYEKSRASVLRNPVWILHHAIALLDQGQRESAASLLDQLPAADASSRFEAGVALGRAGAHREAARLFGTARSGFKDPYAAAYNQILMLIEAGDHGSAIAIAEELIAKGTTPAELYSLVSRAYVKAGRIKDAYEALRTAARLEPTVDEHYIDLALICLDHENYDLGIEVVDVGLHFKPESAPLYLQRGVLLAMKGQVAQAEKAFDKARQIAPHTSVPYVALAMTWMQTGQVAKAVEALRDRVRVNRTDAWLPYMFGIALLRSGIDPESASGTEALQAFESSVRLNPAFAPSHTELGKLLLKRGDIDRAVGELERAAALDSDDAGVLYVLGQAYRRKGDKSRADETLKKASTLRAKDNAADSDDGLKRVVVRIMKEAPAAPTSDGVTEYLDAVRLNPHSVEARYGLALALTNLGDLDGAIELLRHVVSARPQFAEARYNLGLDLWNRFKRATAPRHKNDLDEAIEALRAASELDSRHAPTHSALGQLLTERQRLVPAIASLRKAVDLAPGDAEHAYNLGLALRLNGDLDEAETQFRAALSRDAAHALARRALGLVLRQKGDLQQAAAELRTAVSHRPHDAQGHHLLGTVLLKLNAVSDAVEAFRRAVQLDPQLTEARVNLAQALARSGQHDEARREQAEIQRINEEKAGFARALILIETASNHLKENNAAAAVGPLREAVSLSPDFPEAHYQLALALKAQGDVAEAESAFRRVIELNPKHAAAHYQLGVLRAARGEKTGAVNALRKATELAPSLVDAHRELARIASELGDEKTAAAARTAALTWERLRVP